MNDMFDRLAYAQGPGSEVRGIGRGAAAGLLFAAGASVGLWLGLARAVRWAAATVF